uniref:Uncharacterized protein n=1 Tax=Setaria italica TaxID=4555 RepID=K3ZBT8_SETIT
MALMNLYNSYYNSAQQNIKHFFFFFFFCEREQKTLECNGSARSQRAADLR